MAAGEYTTGSAWLSEEKLLEQARDMWKRLSDEQKGAYGEDYFEQALRGLEKYTKSAVSISLSIFLSLVRPRIQNCLLSASQRETTCRRSQHLKVPHITALLKFFQH